MKKYYFKYNTIKILLIILLIASYYNVFGKDKNNLTENKKAENGKNYPDIKEFSKLHVSGFAKVIIEYSNNYSLKIETNEKIERQLEIISQKGELFILTDIKKFNQHEIDSYGIKQTKNGLKIKKFNNKGLLSIIKTNEGNYLIQDNRIYQTKANNIQDLVTIYIKTPDIELITLDGNVKLILNEEIELNKSNDNKNKENEARLKRNLKINSNLESSIEILDLKLNDITINLYGNSNLDIHKLKASSFTLNSSSVCKSNIKELDIKNISKLDLKENSKFNIDEIKAKELNLFSQGNSKLEFNRIIIEEKVDLNIKDDSKIKIKKLETVNLDLKITENGHIKINNGKTIYKTKIHASGNSIIEMPEVEIKEAIIYAIGTGKAHLKILDKISKTIKNKEYNLKIEGTPQIQEKEVKKEKKLKKKKKKRKKKYKRKK